MLNRNPRETARSIHDPARSASRSRVVCALLVGLLLTPSLGAQIGLDEPVLNQVETADITQKLGATVDTALVFTDETGREVPLTRYFDGTRPVILNMAYFSCPVLCNLVTNGVVEAVQGMEGLDGWVVGEQYRVLTVSIDPRDTAAMARGRKDDLVEQLGSEAARTGWPILTGRVPAIRALADSVGFGYEWSDYQKEYAHGSAIILLSPDGKVTRYLSGIAYDPKVLRLSLVEASEGKVGTLTDHIFLRCFYYDPETGTYGVRLAWITMRVGGVCTVTAMCAAFFFMSRNRREALAARAGDQDER